MFLVIGAGGVGRAIAQRLRAQGEEVGLLQRPHQPLEGGVIRWTNLAEVPFASIRGVFLCVKDAQIRQVAEEVRTYIPPECLIVHTAGSVPLSILSELYGEKAGVLYPLQSFVIGEAVQWGRFPIFWEGPPEVESWAHLLAGTPEQVHFAESSQRLRLHIGAVFTANFLNALFHIGERLAAPIGDRKLYLPLGETVMRRLWNLSPSEAQTGPARRGDLSTIQAHLEYLRQTMPNLATLYEAFTDYIQKAYRFPLQSGSSR
ncbi:MAG: DUF2520 domain-containing protein [Bacteroidia bacterium]|nr:DUF2520 domain-containing protein [Bacteroidia bacterium]